MKAESINKKGTPWGQGNLCRGVFCVEERECLLLEGKTGAKKPGPQARRRSKEI